MQNSVMAGRHAAEGARAWTGHSMLSGPEGAFARRLSLATLVILLAVQGCTITPEYTITFVTVREADFRLGPLPLPLDEDGKTALLAFLERGGDHRIDDYVDAGAEHHYGDLIALLSRPEFLHSRSFRREEAAGEVSDGLTKWFHKPILYQLIDARHDTPRVPRPMCMTDGQYWWIFYMDKHPEEEGSFKVTELLVSAAPSKTLKHYGKIKEDRPDKTHGRHSSARQAAATDAAPSRRGLDAHDELLVALNRIARVHLVSRLRSDKLRFPGNDMRIFIPDLHLLSRKQEKEFKYNTNHHDLLVKLAGELREFKKRLAAAKTEVAVYQLGDFFDLWREMSPIWTRESVSEELPAAVAKMEEDRIDLLRILRSPELNTQFLLGNHDFDVHFLENYIDCELSYYFPVRPGVTPSGVCFHGDILDSFERRMPESAKELGLYYFGPYVKAHTIDLHAIRKLARDAFSMENIWSHIRLPVPAHIESPREAVESRHLPEGDFNVERVGNPEDEEDVLYAKEAKEFARTVNHQTGWDLRFAVIGHTHNPRIVVDETDDPPGFFALIDCGAWIENCRGTGDNVMPNAQIGVIYDNDVRIYQLEPKAR
jgi:UDP-2,3-diacylglucosamine pyrophosphatase LpxH